MTVKPWDSCVFAGFLSRGSGRYISWIRGDIWIALDAKIEKSLLYLEVNKIVGEQEEGTSKFRATLGLL